MNGAALRSGWGASGGRSCNGGRGRCRTRDLEGEGVLECAWVGVEGELESVSCVACD